MKPTNAKRPMVAGREIEDVSRSRYAAMQRCYREGIREYRALSRVIEYDQSEVADENLVKHYASKHWKQVFFDLPDAASDYKTAHGNFGGQTVFFADPRGDKKILIFIRNVVTLDPDAFAGAALPIFFHELGHVDDFVNGLHLVPGTTVDIVAAEHHAHTFALKRLFDGSFQIPLSFYMAALERQSARCGLPTIEEAAKRAINDPMWTRYRQYTSILGDDNWEETFPL